MMKCRQNERTSLSKFNIYKLLMTWFYSVVYYLSSTAHYIAFLVLLVSDFVGF